MIFARLFEDPYKSKVMASIVEHHLHIQAMVTAANGEACKESLNLTHYQV